MYEIFTNGFSAKSTFALVATAITLILFTVILLATAILYLRRSTKIKTIKLVKNGMEKSAQLDKEIQEVVDLKNSNPFIMAPHYFNEINTPEGSLKINGVPVNYESSLNRVDIRKMNIKQASSKLNIKASSDVKVIDVKSTRTILLNDCKLKNKGIMNDSIIEYVRDQVSCLKKINKLEVEASILLRISTEHKMPTNNLYVEDVCITWMGMSFSRYCLTTGFNSSKIIATNSRRSIKKSIALASTDFKNVESANTPFVTSDMNKRSVEPLVVNVSEAAGEAIALNLESKVISTNVDTVLMDEELDVEMALHLQSDANTDATLSEFELNEMSAIANSYDEAV